MRVKIGIAVLSWASSAFALAPPAVAHQSQEDADFERIELRVIEVRPSGLIVVDRGSVDGLAIGDLVRFFPRDGRTLAGNVGELEARSALVELFDPGAPPAVGSRGRVRVPASRFAPELPQGAAPGAEPNAAATGGPGTPVQDEGAPAPSSPPDVFAPRPLGSLSKPLLSQMDSVRPADRAMSFTGRAYLTADTILASLDDRHDLFLRAGQDLSWDNPFGRGGRLNVDLEENYRRTEIPGPGDENETRLRIDRLGYSWGGTRFDNDRFEVGRFLQLGMPEFGILDGLEYSTRFDSGDRFGASLGFLPEPDFEQETGRDLQVATWYRWVADEEERLTATAGFQKTLHDGDADRDLVVAKFEALPRNGWNFFGTAWIDLYTSGDDLRGPGIGLTQLQATAIRRFDDGDTLDVSYRHLEFPELDRDEFTPVFDEQISDDHLDRLWLRGSSRRSEDRRVHGALGAWVDEDAGGADIEGGYEMLDLFASDDRADVTLFGGKAEFNSFAGVRLQYGRSTMHGRWLVLYEYTGNQQDEFAGTAADIVQHRVRASQELHFPSGWSLSFYGQGTLWDEENALALGFHLQRDF